MTLHPIPLFVPGPPELLIVLALGILLFGANKIPKLARSTGEALGEFQKGQEKVEQELEEMRQDTKDAIDPDTRPTTNTDTAATDETETDTDADN